MLNWEKCFSWQYLSVTFKLVALARSALFVMVCDWNQCTYYCETETLALIVACCSIMALLMGRVISWLQVESAGNACTSLKGKAASTKFTRISTNGTHSIVLCEPITGRTHQVNRFAFLITNLCPTVFKYSVMLSYRLMMQISSSATYIAFFALALHVHRHFLSLYISEESNFCLLH